MLNLTHLTSALYLASAEAGHSTPNPHPGMIAPFVIMLLAIALMPFIHKHWWEKHYPKVAMGLGTISILYYVFVLHHPVRIAHVAHEYVSFICLIGSLFVVSGGIHIQVKGLLSPVKNSIFLAIGAVLANIIGTTGAAMLLVRPWIKTNEYRIKAYHIIFFIFIVANTAGCLTPIGDPPLFLGYLKHIPFEWEIQRLWIPWLICVFLIILTFFIFDTLSYRSVSEEQKKNAKCSDSWQFQGLRNIWFIGLILFSVFLPSPFHLPEPFTQYSIFGWRELGMVAAAVLSLKFTPKEIHEKNAFNFEPIREVAWLFIGIFATMVAALDYLSLHASSMGIDTPMKFYWLTGSLSAVLDNAPTYLTFLTTSISQHAHPATAMMLDVNTPAHVDIYIQQYSLELAAISLGAVFFGAMTYIGNGPNFMVKAIAEQSRINMPSFFGYVIKYSLPILIPIFTIVALLFFSPWKVFLIQ